MITNTMKLMERICKFRIVFAILAFVFISFGAIGQQKAIKEPSFRLYPTQNMWTFIMLDTEYGRIWQVQYSMEEGNRSRVVLNSQKLALSGEAGRFALYPTQNMWTFILLDQTDSRTWQVQWSQDANNRGIIPIR